MPRGRLIAFAGIDGSGKTTQAGLAARWLREWGFTTALQASTGPSFTRRVLTDLADSAGLTDYMDLLGPEMTRMVGATVRYRDWTESLLPELERSEFVVVDRYMACFYASVRALGATNEHLLRRMFRTLPAPDLTVLVEIAPEHAVRRIQARGTDHERPDYLAAMASAYREIPEYADFAVVDGSAEPARVHQRVRELISARFGDVVTRSPEPAARRYPP
jgi:dTMP kinase